MFRQIAVTAWIVASCASFGTSQRGFEPLAVQVPTGASALAPTTHPPIPATAVAAWLVPAPDAKPTESERALAAGIDRLNAGDYVGALRLLESGVQDGSPVAPWARYYLALTYWRAGRNADAVGALEPLTATPPAGALGELAARALADAAEAAGDLPRSMTVLTTLAERAVRGRDEVLKHLAEVSSRAGEGGRARAAWLRLYYEYPTSTYAALAEPYAAEARLASGVVSKEIFARDLARAEALFAGKRYPEARRAFERLKRDAEGDTRELVDLRLAECDYYAKNYKAALTGLEPWLARGSRQAEARFFHLSALRLLNRLPEYFASVRTLVQSFPQSTWAEDALDGLATFHIIKNDDASAAEVFKEILQRFPSGRHAARAAWKYGWWQYKLGSGQAEAAEAFERASLYAPRSDYRPSWLYWAGRSREALGQADQAAILYGIAISDYRHSYYGRLAAERVAGLEKGGNLRAAPIAAVDVVSTPPADADPPTRDLIQRLLVAGLWNEAILEIEEAQRTSGSTPTLTATLAYAYAQKGDLRRGIVLMKRAYPQYLAQGGERLPREILEVIFPVDHWDLIRKHAASKKLDPHLVAALVAQESTFDEEARSPANARGLMQIMPATGRRLARVEGVSRFTPARLNDPELNVRLGTRYLASLIDRFGGLHFALASYNAGESRVVRWRAERPGLGTEEFIDDIPFPETQNYVKKILGTADDYRLLYPGRSGD